MGARALVSAQSIARAARRRKKKARRERQRTARYLNKITESLNRGLDALERIYGQHTFAHAEGPKSPPVPQ